MDEMWGRVYSKETPCWLWHAINHENGDVIAYVLGSREHDMLQQLLDLINGLNLNISAVYSDNILRTTIVLLQKFFKPVKRILKKSSANILLFELV